MGASPVLRHGQTRRSAPTCALFMLHWAALQARVGGAHRRNCITRAAPRVRLSRAGTIRDGRLFWPTAFVAYVRAKQPPSDACYELAH
jgi:hypothetical protein